MLADGSVGRRPTQSRRLAPSILDGSTVKLLITGLEGGLPLAAAVSVLLAAWRRAGPFFRQPSAKDNIL